MGEKGRPWGLPFWFGGSRERLCRIGRWSGFGPAQVQTCEVSRPVLAGGSRLSRESPDARVAGEGPRPFLWPARSHSLVLAWWGRSGAVVGLLRCPCTCPDLETFFRKNAFQHIFPRKCVPNRSWHTEETAPLSYQRQRSPKRANGSERAMNPGVQGLAPVFFPRLSSKESRAPPPESAGNPRCRVHPATVPTEPPIDDRGPPRPHIGSRWTRAAMARAARTPEAPAWARPRVIPAPSPAAKKLGRAVSRSGESFSRAE